MIQKQTKVLIAEDNEDARRLIEKLLKECFPDKNLMIFGVSTLRAAQQIAHVRGPIDLGLIDLELEDSKPHETGEAIPGLKCGAVIAMSGVASGEARKHARRAGAVDYVEKPIVAELLIDKVARVFGKNDDDSGQMSEVQHRAQKRLQERVAQQDTVITPGWSSASSKWAKFVLPLSGASAAILIYMVGNLQGAWREQEKKGAEKQALVDDLHTIKTDLTDIKAASKFSNDKREVMEKNILKLCVKVGVEPERN